MRTGWAVWVPAAARPAILNRKHDDWPGPLSRIPRAWNAWITTAAPRKLLGTERPEDHLDIPEPGKWVLAMPGGAFGLVWMGLFAGCVVLALATGLIIPIPPPLHFSIRLGGWLLRISIVRHDYVDGYETGPAFTLKRL